MSTLTGQSNFASVAEVAKHFRKRLRHEGIAARCKSYRSCGYDWIRISQPHSPDTRFTDEQQRTIRLIALACHLTGPQGSPIDLERMTDSWEAVFVWSAQS